MKISLNWLKEYISLKDVSSEEIISKLNMCGLEVEDSVNQNKIFKDFIVGFVKEKKKHPNADKLSLCTVDTGKEELQVICGAPNVDAGQKVVFAPIGTLIPKGDFKITKAKIRGIESCGMICSEDELELSDDHSGIMILAKSLEQGTPITEALKLNDVILEISITPNRPDALSHIGVARDLAAIFNVDLKIPEIKLIESSKKIEEFASVEIEDTVNCPRYSSKVITGITVKESPEWLKKKLTNVGLRPINNIVDVTNFVMYETGQPLHAFDLDKLHGNKIIVKSTKEESTFVSLDSKERKLSPGTLMICDGEKPVAIAGIMGGENSEISLSTKNILIESAYFNTSSIRKTSKTLSLSTDASYRFERGIDPSGTLYSAERAAQLISELSGGEILNGSIDVYPNKIEKKITELRFSRLGKILGYNISKEKVMVILSKLGFDIINKSDEKINCKIPSYRPDIEREIDLIEEIARINGYENIPTISKINISLGEKTDESKYTDDIRNILTSLGFFEMINNPLQSEKAASVTGYKIPVLNPQSADMAYLRTSLIPGALTVVSKNINVGEKDLSLFEIGNTFNKNASAKEIKSFDDFIESQKVIFLITGKSSNKTWNTSEKSVDFYELKGMAESIATKISLDNVLEDSYYHSEETVYDLYFTKSYSNAVVGKGGRVKKEVLKQFDINQNVFCFEFEVDGLKKIPVNAKRFEEPLKYPKVVRDFAFIFDKVVTFEEVLEFIKKNGSSLLKSAGLFDLFENESLGENKKSMAFTLEYFSAERTLTEEEVEKEFLGLISSVTKKFDAKLRGN
ncbi:MAG: phenylalanine--tRNA ligase subunit beta [Ignavibacteriaceae bacterium]